MRAAIEGGYEENEEGENGRKVAKRAHGARRAKRRIMCSRGAQVADSPLFEHAVNLPSSLLSLPRLNFSLSSLSFSLSRGLFFRGYKHARALMFQNGCVRARVYT